MPYFVMFCAIVTLFLLLSNQEPVEPTPEKFPVKFPLEPMFENYQSIVEEIRAASTRDQIYACYVRYIIFASFYKDAASFVSELYEMYSEKEASLVAA